MCKDCESFAHNTFGPTPKHFPTAENKTLRLNSHRLLSGVQVTREFIARLGKKILSAVLPMRMFGS